MLRRSARSVDPDPTPLGRSTGGAGRGAGRWMQQVGAAADAPVAGARRCGRSARVPAHAEGRPEADWRRVRAAHRGARRGDAAAADAQPRHAAGDRQRDDQRTLQRHRPRRFAEPAPHLRLPARRPPADGGCPCARRRFCSTLARRAYRRPVNRADVQDLLPFYDAGRERGQLRSRHPEGARAAARQPAVPVPHRARAGERWRPARRIASATSSSPRGCRSSSGAASRTTSCSTRRARDG